MIRDLEVTTGQTGKFNYVRTSINQKEAKIKREGGEIGENILIHTAKSYQLWFPPPNLPQPRPKVLQTQSSKRLANLSQPLRSHGAIAHPKAPNSLLPILHRAAVFYFMYFNKLLSHLIFRRVTNTPFSNHNGWI